MEPKAWLSSGWPGLDRILQGLRAGDNVVWVVDNLADYRPVVEPLAVEAGRYGRRLIYFHFARHAPLFEPGPQIILHTLDPAEGFERFVTGILEHIEHEGRAGWFAFDCLSELAADWFSDRMLGNFFRIVCPYLYELDALAYFALLKNEHSFHATESIHQTAQVVIEVWRKDGKYFIHPVKVWQRHSPTLYLLHRREGAEFVPVTSSAAIADILRASPRPGLEFSVHRPGIWRRTFYQAQEVLKRLQAGESAEEASALFERLLMMLTAAEGRLLDLARRHFDLAQLVEIMQRMIGTGRIGGKALGMLLARAILCRSDPRWRERLEIHDSFYVGSDVFYTYLVQNGCWWLRRRHPDFNTWLERAELARRKILEGTFPDDIRDQFVEMLEYFGQSPIIVRSSSLLEDNYGNAFSGKYQSVFCTNQGTPAQRLEGLLNAVRTVYASALSEDGLRYRHLHGLLDRDEQMALLIQRVSGEMHERYFFPHLAGVGFSFNPYAWHEEIDPSAGVLRLVFGLGTRAVDRVDDDYARLVALNAPLKRPEGGGDEGRAFVQRRVDLLDLEANQLVSRDFASVVRALPPELAGLFTADETATTPPAPTRDRTQRQTLPVLSLDRILQDTWLVPAMRDLCATLEAAYGCPVDVEFTANLTPDKNLRVNLVQCRPFQVKIAGSTSRIQVPEQVEPADLFFRSRGPIVGHSVASLIERVVYVVPQVYCQLGMSQRYSVARTIGRLLHLDGAKPRRIVMLAGPGRWGTSMPSLGVPVSFAEINTASVLCELTVMHAGLVPDVSLGTHFFNDLVEMDMLYLAVCPGRPEHVFNEEFLRHRPNQLPRLLPSAGSLVEVLWVVDFNGPDAKDALQLNVDSHQQLAVCYREKSRPAGF